MYKRQGYTLCADKRVEIGEHLKYVPMGFLNSNSLGYVTSITTNTLENLQDVATRVVMMSTQGFINTCIIGLCVLVYDYRIGIVIFSGILIFLFVNGRMQKKSNDLAPIKTESDSRLVENILEYVQGISVVKSYNLAYKSGQKVTKAIDDNEKINFKMEKTFIPYMSLQTFVLKFMGIVVILTSIYFYINNSMAVSYTHLTASAVSMCGQVGWIGLLIPHISRMLVGTNHKRVIPVSISLGASYMIIIDTFARSMVATEIPLSILTAIVGAPFLSLIHI